MSRHMCACIERDCVGDLSKAIRENGRWTRVTVVFHQEPVRIVRVRGGGQISQLQAASRRSPQERAVRSLLSGKHQAVSATVTATVHLVHTTSLSRARCGLFLRATRGNDDCSPEISTLRVFVYVSS